MSIVIRAYPLISESIDGDELFSRDAATDFFDSGIEQIKSDLTHPPLHYFLLHFVLNTLGDSLISLRLISLVSATLLITAIMLLVFLFNRQQNCWFFSRIIDCFIIDRNLLWRASSKLFTLFTINLPFSNIFFILQKRKDNYLCWITYCFLMIISLLTHYISIFYLIALGIYILIMRKYDVILRWIIFSVPSILGLMVWLFYLLPYYYPIGGIPTNLSWIEIPNLFSLIYLFAMFNGVPEINKEITIIHLVYC